jgi:hypothetical protein
MAVPGARVGAVGLHAEKAFGDERFECDDTLMTVEAAEPLNLVRREVQARHRKVLGANTVFHILGGSHATIVARPPRVANGQLGRIPCRRDHVTGCRGRALRRSLAAAVAAVAACRPVPVPLDVAVRFDNSWRIGAEPLTPSERTVVVRTALDTLRGAFDGFAVRIVEASGGARVVRVEDTPFSSVQLFGESGVTFPTAIVSSVRADLLANATLASVHCRAIVPCPTARWQIVEGWGRGIGATAAHELGHQRGFRFALDVACDDCYDGRASTSYAHFFGRKRWSDGARAIMARTLPRAGVSRR